MGRAGRCGAQMAGAVEERASPSGVIQHRLPGPLCHNLRPWTTLPNLMATITPGLMIIPVIGTSRPDTTRARLRDMRATVMTTATATMGRTVIITVPRGTTARSPSQHWSTWLSS